jgi:hypothetical protein
VLVEQIEKVAFAGQQLAEQHSNSPWSAPLSQTRHRIDTAGV